jgi:branched-subunit amino acid transport protein
MNYSSTETWIIIVLMAIGTYLIRFSFLGPLANMKMPPGALRLLRYTPVAVIPGLVAPLVLWPAATGGQPDLARTMAAATALALGAWTKNVIVAIFGGAGMLYLMLYLVG